MEDPFKSLRALVTKRRNASDEFWREVSALRAAGYSLRTIADVAQMSHNTIYRRAG